MKESFFFNRFVAERKRCFRPTAILMIRFVKNSYVVFLIVFSIISF